MNYFNLLDHLLMLVIHIMVWKKSCALLWRFSKYGTCGFQLSIEAKRVRCRKDRQNVVCIHLHHSKNLNALLLFCLKEHKVTAF